MFDRLPRVELRHGLESLPLGSGATVVTVGFFDGVHLGHRAVLGRTVEVARERGLPSVAVTFDRHPREVLSPGQEPRLLTTVDRRADLIEETGIDVLLVLEFTPEFSRWPAEAFIMRVLEPATISRQPRGNEWSSHFCNWLGSDASTAVR